MARYKKEVVREVTVINCDFCDYIVEDDWSVCTRFDIMTCDLCGKDTCLVCVDEACEDGQLCKECSKEHYFHSSTEEGVGIINRNSGEPVEWYMDKIRKGGIPPKMWSTKES